MVIRDLLKKFEEKYPLDLQEDWDNSGLQVGNVNKELKGIVLSLDLEYQTIEKAIETGSNLIINHHPLLFNPLKSLDLTEDLGKKLELLIKNDISLYAAHTNLDASRGGVNDNLSDILGLKDVEILKDSEEVNMVRYGFVEEMKAKDFAKKAKEVLKASSTILYGDPDKNISKIAVCGGGGASFFSDAIKKNFDLMLTGDVKYHEAIDAIAEGILILDPGHFASENHIIYKLKDDLKQMTDTDIHTYSKEDKFRVFL